MAKRKTKKAKAPSGGKTVAKVNKSQAIRDFVTANRSASAKEVVAELALKKIKVTAAMVANVKSKAGLTKRRGRGKPAGKKNSKTSTNGSVDIKGQLSVEMLIEAKKLIHTAGSAKTAVAAIRAIEKIESAAV